MGIDNVYGNISFLVDGSHLCMNVNTHAMMPVRSREQLLGVDSLAPLVPGCLLCCSDAGRSGLAGLKTS